MTNAELVEAIRKDLEARQTWDTRQAMFYQMRHHGLRRTNKPWPNASDVHFPLCDSSIERLKPVYFQQLFASDLLANFVPAGQGLQSAEHTSAAALWFDYQVKHRLDFERQVLRVIDCLLWGGKGVAKATWDPEASKIRVEAIPAQLIIVPQWSTDVEDLDRIVHVRRWSMEAYRRQTQLRQGDEIEKKIVGAGDTEDSGDDTTREARYLREGLTHADDGTIITWEVWTRDGDKWMWKVLSPLAPEDELKSEVESEYFPFVAFDYEEKEAGWYSSRGVVEIQATFEAELCKLLNEKNDAMTLSNRPLFRDESGVVGNQTNLRFIPGQILPKGITPVSMPPPPIAFDQQIILIRDIAERLINVPDFGMSRVSNQDSRTATEIAAIGASSQQSTDLRMRVFRMGLSRLYRLLWKLLRLYKAEDLQFWSEERLVSVPHEAIAGEYRIEPSGSADGVTRQQGFQKAVARLQLLGQSPFVDQGELTKTVLESDDPGLVKRLYRDPGTKAADQTEEQGKEIGVMLLGFPVAVSPSDDHPVHLMAILDYVMRAAQQGQQAQPEVMQMLMPHTLGHLQALQQSDPQKAKQFERMFAQLSQQQQQPQQQPLPA